MNNHNLLSIYYLHDIRLGGWTEQKILYLLQDICKSHSIVPVFTVEHTEADSSVNYKWPHVNKWQKEIWSQACLNPSPTLSTTEHRVFGKFRWVTCRKCLMVWMIPSAGLYWLNWRAVFWSSIPLYLARASLWCPALWVLETRAFLSQGQGCVKGLHVARSCRESMLCSFWRSLGFPFLLFDIGWLFGRPPCRVQGPSTHGALL